MSAIIFLLILSVLVLVHELGHYVAARLFGVKAEEFGYGFPPRAIGFVCENGKWKRVSATDKHTYKKTIWSLNWLPLGGFVRLKGEQGEFADQDDSFQSKKLWQKFIILAAGVFMNWVLAASIFAFGFMVGVPAELAAVPSSAVITDKRVEVTEVVSGSAAEKAGFLVGDILLTVDKQTVNSAPELRTQLSTATESTKLEFSVQREKEFKTINAAPLYLEELKRPGFGFGLTDIGTVRFSPLTATYRGAQMATSYAGAIVAGFGELITDLFNGGKQAADVSGPVGIAVMTGQVAQQGWWAILHFTAILSLNLAVINFLPIPALDGGRALFVIFEMIRRKKHNAQTEAIVHQIGFFALIILILIVTLKDLQKHGPSIWHGLLSIFGI